MRCCILVAGMPASGKTTFAEYASKELSLPLVSKDKIKEILYDTVGFASREEKAAIGLAGTNILYYYASTLMAAGQPFILENNFEDRNKPALQKLFDKYGYRCLVIRFGGDIEVIYQRYLKREKGGTRHKGHGNKPDFGRQEKELLLAPMTFEEFVEGVSRRGISNFSLGGEELAVDTTSFEKVSYEAISTKIWNVLYGMQGWKTDC